MKLCFNKLTTISQFNVCTQHSRPIRSRTCNIKNLIFAAVLSAQQQAVNSFMAMDILYAEHDIVGSLLFASTSNIWDMDRHRKRKEHFAQTI